MGDVEFTPRAFSKVILHAAKYPHCAVNGLLLAKEVNDSKNSKNLVFVDAVPLFHLCLQVAPMAEIALTQVDQIALSQGQVIAGYYFANKNFSDNSPDVVARRLSDKIAENYSSACLVAVNNTKMTLDMKESPLSVTQFSGNKWSPVSSLVPDSILNATSIMLQERWHEFDLVDFDNHLDDIALDWKNSKLNEAIDKLVETGC
ncbi:unnamed protein product [Bemisia tabaci]|uniref:MPN domain-containing protein n=1 Tax=Bemisia tabaci TaxID=7038 RepID=A0A9P0EZ97_BEMTA|nr:PREDICTED: ER membrane protein complex subunit 8/9 homolog [Bemisia tabaci]CAH0381667.1 unnamed protein product [Bemisia tabaci]